MASRTSSLLACVLLYGGLQACQNASVARAPHEPPVANDLASVEQTLHAMLVHAQQCERDSDCALLPLGHRACGGPDRYAVYSVLSPAANQTERLAARHRQLSAQQQAGRMGICVVARVPAVRCEQQRCTASDASAVQ